MLYQKAREAMKRTAERIKMKVSELIELLKQAPYDAPVLFESMAVDSTLHTMQPKAWMNDDMEEEPFIITCEYKAE
jgi:hypothetical protein